MLLIDLNAVLNHISLICFAIFFAYPAGAWAMNINEPSHKLSLIQGKSTVLPRGTKRLKSTLKTNLLLLKTNL